MTEAIRTKLPTYQYVCKKGHPYEEIRSMTEDQRRKTCVNKGCGTKLSRVFSAPPITFKGAGFSKPHA
jgi:putative FmdB family regulatory protein